MVQNTKKRGRPLGSSTKKNTNLVTIKMERNIEGAPITRPSAMGYVSWRSQQ